MSSYTPDVIKVLKAYGCSFYRHAKGDHDTWYSPINGRYFGVDHKILSRHTANEIMKQAGIKHRF